MADPEQNPSQRVLDGIPSLAAFMSSDPDHSAFVFKRFDRAAARNLLYLQGEIAELQAQQDAFDAEDCSVDGSDLQTGRCAMGWAPLVEAAAAGDEKQKKRLELIYKLRERLKEYREALVLESTLAAMESPSRRTADAMYHVATRLHASKGSRLPILAGSSAEIYEFKTDLVALKHSEHADRVTTFVYNYLGSLLHSSISRDGMAYVPEHRVTRLVSLISIVSAVALLYAPIIALYLIKNEAVQLTLIGIFMAFFAVNVGLFTTAKRSEIFAATATYAAVLAVFVSGPLAPESKASAIPQP